MKKIILFHLFILIFCASHAQQKHHKHKEPQNSKDSTSSIIKYGTASFYAKKFNGRRTANGEIFDSQKYTAACNLLRLNTWVKITNLRNSKTVIVRINDRMHPKNKRLIDLSKIAAKDLGFSGWGLAHVKLEVLKNYHS